jgi:hypothetical protein
VTDERGNYVGRDTGHEQDHAEADRSSVTAYGVPDRPPPALNTLMRLGASTCGARDHNRPLGTLVQLSTWSM